METHELSGKAIIDGLRTARHTYVEYGTGERELYDLQADPYQLTTRPRRPTPCCSRPWPCALAELKNCASANCRMLEDLPVEPMRRRSRSMTRHKS